MFVCACVSHGCVLYAERRRLKAKDRGRRRGARSDSAKRRQLVKLQKNDAVIAANQHEKANCCAILSNGRPSGIEVKAM